MPSTTFVSRPSFLHLFSMLSVLGVELANTRPFFFWPLLRYWSVCLSITLSHVEELYSNFRCLVRQFPTLFSFRLSCLLVFISSSEILKSACWFSQKNSVVIFFLTRNCIVCYVWVPAMASQGKSQFLS